MRTEVKQPGGPPIPIDYSMEKTDKGWKVYDVVIDGVSLVTTYRGSFNDQIQKSGIDGLVKTLQDRNSAAARQGARPRPSRRSERERRRRAARCWSSRARCPSRRLPRVLAESDAYEAQPDLPERLTIDFSGVTAVDSSAVALLLEWRRRALAHGKHARLREPARQPPRARRALRRERSHPGLPGLTAWRGARPVAVEVRGVEKRFGAVRALDGVDLEVRARRVLRAARSQRRRQDHAHLRARRPRASPTRARSR